MSSSWITVALFSRGNKGFFTEFKSFAGDNLDPSQVVLCQDTGQLLMSSLVLMSLIMS